MTFNYKTSTDQELINHIRNSPSSTVSVAKAYHQSKGNIDIVQRINQCRMFLKQERMQAQLSKLQMENANYGNNLEQFCPGMDRQEPATDE